MVDSIGDASDWEELEHRIEQNVDLHNVRDRDTFRQALVHQFFTMLHPETRERVSYRPTNRQLEMVDILWDRMGEDVIRERREINILIKQFPHETARYAKAIRLYPNILKEFVRGRKRSDIAKDTAQRNGKSWKTVDRDIYSMVKIGILEKTKKRGFYRVISNLYV